MHNLWSFLCRERIINLPSFVYLLLREVGQGHYLLNAPRTTNKPLQSPDSIVLFAKAQLSLMKNNVLEVNKQIGNSAIKSYLNEQVNGIIKAGLSTTFDT